MYNSQSVRGVSPGYQQAAAYQQAGSYQQQQQQPGQVTRATAAQPQQAYAAPQQSYTQAAPGQYVVRSGPVQHRVLVNASDSYLNLRQRNGQAPAQRSEPKDVAGGNKVLELALQALLNVQNLDKKIFSQAILAREDGKEVFDARGLVAELQARSQSLLGARETLSQRVKRLTKEDALTLLQDIGLEQAHAEEAVISAQRLDMLRDEILNVLSDALPVSNLDAAVGIMAQRRLRQFLERRGVTKYSEHIVSLRHHEEPWAHVWARIRLQYPASQSPSSLGMDRQSMRVVIIGPGFGMLATPHMINLVREAGYQLLELPTLPNPESMQSDAEMQQAVQALREQIASFQPHVVVAASKGGLYFPHLWQDPSWETACVLINAHPNITKLPARAAVVVTQGSRDETFKRIDERHTLVLENDQAKGMLMQCTTIKPLRRQGDPPGMVVQQAVQIPSRTAGVQSVPAGAIILPEAQLLGSDPSRAEGYDRVTNMEELMNLRTPAAIAFRSGREDLEALACTAPQGKCLLYLSTCGMSVRPGKPVSYTRLGDGHAAPESLCKEDCLPRLIDSAAWGQPEDAIHMSWAGLVPEARRESEAFLGYDPQNLRRFWVGEGDQTGSGCRVPVDPQSDEFYAVDQIFRANVVGKNYDFGIDWTAKGIVKVERVESVGQIQATDGYYERVKQDLEAQGTAFVGGVHTRWLFHGSPAIDSIISDPLEGFKITLAHTTMWGAGIYFARDAQYPDDHGFTGKPKEDGTKEMLLTLVVTGMSCLGDDTYSIMPYRFNARHRYNSFVDSLSNPEIMVVNSSSAALPAYVITYAEAQ